MNCLTKIHTGRPMTEPRLKSISQNLKHLNTLSVHKINQSPIAMVVSKKKTSQDTMPEESEIKIQVVLCCVIMTLRIFSRSFSHKNREYMVQDKLS